jgi:hypothetical protein
VSVEIEEDAEAPELDSPPDELASRPRRPRRRPARNARPPGAELESEGEPADARKSDREPAPGADRRRPVRISEADESGDAVRAAEAPEGELLAAEDGAGDRHADEPKEDEPFGLGVF